MQEFIKFFINATYRHANLKYNLKVMNMLWIWVHVQIDCHKQQMCKDIIMGTPLFVPITMIGNTLSVQCAKSAQQQHVRQVHIREDQYISSPRKYWDIMLWVHKKPNQSPPYSDTWMHTQNNLLISIHTFMYISVYFEIVNTFILQGETSLTFYMYMLITPSHHSLSS